MQTKAYGSFFAGNEPKFVIVREFGDCVIIKVVRFRNKT